MSEYHLCDVHDLFLDHLGGVSDSQLLGEALGKSQYSSHPFEYTITISSTLIILSPLTRTHLNITKIRLSFSSDIIVEDDELNRGGCFQNSPPHHSRWAQRRKVERPPQGRTQIHHHLRQVQQTTRQRLVQDRTIQRWHKVARSLLLHS